MSNNEPLPHAGVTLTREQVDTILATVRQIGENQLRANRWDFNETYYLIGVATALQAVTDGEHNTSPRLVIDILSGRSFVDPDGKIKKALGMRSCIYCGEEATTEIDGDPFCDRCHEEI